MKKILLLLAVVLLYSCKKDGLANRYLISSETVTEYITPDSTLNEQVDFQYDNQNRLTTVTRNWGPRYYVETDNYQYDNGGNLTALTLDNGISTSTYLTSYDNGYPVSTTYTGSNPTFTIYYTFENNRLAEADYGNMIEDFSYHGNNYSNLSYSDNVDYIYTYGTHISPFKYTGYKYPLLGLSFVVNDNEILQIKTVSGTTTNTTTYNYTYNSQGYPSKLESHTNGTLASIVTINYKKMQ